MKGLIQYFLTLLEPAPYLGIADDNRSIDQKNNDISYFEVAGGATTVLWVVKLQENWKRFKQRFQTNSASCVAQTSAKIVGIEQQTNTGSFVELSALDDYDRRSNKPGEGMITMEGLQITCDHGLTSEALLPSQNMSEEQMNQPVIRTDAMIAFADQFKGGTAVKLPVDMDVIAGVVDQGYGVMLCLQFSQKEWTAYPTRISKGSIRHAVTIIDRTVWNGQKAFVIEDSWLPETTINGKGQRVVTEDFILDRCFFVGYRHNPKPITLPQSVKHIFTRDLRFIPIDNYGHISNIVENDIQKNEVICLQDRLKLEHYLSVNVPSTGYFGALTLNALKAYQAKHNLPTTGFCGPMTRAILNK